MLETDKLALRLSNYLDRFMMLLDRRVPLADIGRKCVAPVITPDIWPSCPADRAMSA